MIEDDELYHRAVKAYFRRYPGADCPNTGLSTVEWYGTRNSAAVVTLKNVRGRLAAYRYSEASDRLREIALPDDEGG